jgi:hypothetical protein
MMDSSIAQEATQVLGFLPPPSLSVGIRRVDRLEYLGVDQRDAAYDALID